MHIFNTLSIIFKYKHSDTNYFFFSLYISTNHSFKLEEKKNKHAQNAESP